MAVSPRPLSLTSSETSPDRSVRRIRQLAAPEWRITLVAASRRHQASAASASGSKVPDRMVRAGSSSRLNARGVHRGAGRDDLDGERRPTVAAHGFPDVLQRLAADPADVGDIAQHRIQFGRLREPGDPPGRQLGLQRDQGQRLAGQVVHVPREPQPLLVGRELGHGLPRLPELVHEHELQPEADHGPADQHHGQQHDA